MINSLILRLPILALVLFGVGACSTIKSWFPDKERDYQFTTEIAELVVPDDLKAGGIVVPPKPEPEPASIAPSTNSSKGLAETLPPETEPAAEKQSEAEATVAETASKSATGDTSATQAGTGSSLQIDQPQKQASRIVARAMSRQKLEIVERNLDKGYFYVKFDPDAVKAEDKSIADELNFLFGDDPSQEEEYRITLQEINPQLTEVTVQDSTGKTLSNIAANALLKLITDAINNDVPAGEPAAENQENKDKADGSDAGAQEGKSAEQTNAGVDQAQPAENSENVKVEPQPSVLPENAPQDSKPAEASENTTQDSKPPSEQ